MITTEKIIEGVLDAEGAELTDDPADRGGRTKWGITQRTLEESHASGDFRPGALPMDVANLTRDEAGLIYRVRYISRPGFDEIPDLRVQREVVDTGVNMGPGTAARFLQRALRLLNDGGRLYDDIVVDGRVGPNTIAALEAFLGHRRLDGRNVLLRVLNAQQVARYLEIAENDPDQERFLYGWIRARTG